MWRAVHENVEGVQSTLRGCICTFLRVPYTLFWGCKQFLSVQYWNSVALQIHTTFICSVSLCVCFFLVCKRHFLRFLSSAVLCCYCCECINTFWGYAKHLEWFLRLAHENPQPAHENVEGRARKCKVHVYLARVYKHLLRVHKAFRVGFEAHTWKSLARAWKCGGPRMKMWRVCKALLKGAYVPCKSV